MTDLLTNYNLVTKLTDQKVAEGDAKGHFGYATATGFLSVHMTVLLNKLEVYAPDIHKEEIKFLQSLLNDDTH